MMESDKKRWIMVTMEVDANLKDDYFEEKRRFSVGMETITKTPYISFPVFNHMAEYEEYYWLEDEEYELFLKDHDAANAFSDKCKRREMDERLMFTPGRLRGWA